MQAMIEDFRILPAGHCGSGAMRNLIYHYCNLDLPEGVVFGLGAGIDTVYFAYEKAQPPFMFFGRGSSMETDVAHNLGIDYREQTVSDDDTAWDNVKTEVLNGKPTMLSGDIFYLDYREYKVHFPGHRFILLGFNEDAEEVYIADRINTHAETCSMGALRLSRSADAGISSHNLWGKFHSSHANNSLPEACGLALKMSVERMQGIDQSQRDLMQAAAGGKTRCATGLDGLRAMQQDFPQWQGLPDAVDRITYIDNAIVKFGTGGGFFRDHYARFMEWSRKQRPDLVSDDCVALANTTATQWNALSPMLQSLSAAPDDTALWARCTEQFDDIFHTEYLLFGQLGDTVLGAVTA